MHALFYGFVSKTVRDSLFSVGMHVPGMRVRQNREKRIFKFLTLLCEIPAVKFLHLNQATNYVTRPFKLMYTMSDCIQRKMPCAPAGKLLEH